MSWRLHADAGDSKQEGSGWKGIYIPRGSPDNTVRSLPVPRDEG